MLSEREREIIECLLREWTQGDMSIYGGLSYQDVFDLMKKLGVDTTEAETELENRSNQFRQVATQLGYFKLADTAEEVREIVEQCRREVYGEDVRPAE